MIWRRPLGIWLAGFAMLSQAAGHVRLAIMGFESYEAMALAILLFLASLILLIMRRVSAMIYGTSFFIIGLYKTAEIYVHSPMTPIVHIVVWCTVSLVGISGLLFNRRWFDEPMIRFLTPDE